MNYWLLISALWFLPSKENKGGIEDSKQKDFIEILPQKKWSLVPGDKQNVTISFMIENGYHIQADKVLDENLIPTSITLIPLHDIVVKDPIFPHPEFFQLKNSSSEMLVFSGRIEILIPLEVTESVPTGELQLKGRLHYQTCDSAKCYFPRDLAFEIPLVIQ